MIATQSLDGARHSGDKETSVPAYGSHDIGVWTETTAPTCTAPGEERRDCSRCDYYETREVKANGHDMGEWTETTAPSCTEAGEQRRDCKHCDYYETEVLSALGHSWGRWTVVTAATETEAGLKRRVCTRCSATEELQIPPERRRHSILLPAQLFSA